MPKVSSLTCDRILFVGTVDGDDFHPWHGHVFPDILLTFIPSIMMIMMMMMMMVVVVVVVVVVVAVKRGGYRHMSD